MDNQNQICWSPGLTLLQMELMVVGCAHRYYKENKSQAAKSLDIDIKTFNSKLAEIEVMEEKERDAERERLKQRELFNQRARGVAPSSQLNWAESPPAPGTAERERMESPSDVSAQSALSMPKLEEVQKMLPRQATGNSQRPRR